MSVSIQSIRAKFGAVLAVSACLASASGWLRTLAASSAGALETPKPNGPMTLTASSTHVFEARRGCSPSTCEPTRWVSISLVRFSRGAPGRHRYEHRDRGSPYLAWIHRIVPVVPSGAEV
jgi:hypothetical protein